MDLDLLLDFLAGYPGWGRLEQVRLNLARSDRDWGGVYPLGFSERRQVDICGTVRARNRYGFELWFSLREGEDSARWVLGLQEWIQRESLEGRAPRFGKRTVGIYVNGWSLRSVDLRGRGLYRVDMAVEVEME